MREKLIELLTEAEFEAEVMCIKQPDCDKCPHAKIGCQSVTIVDHLIANGVTIQKWIPASEPPTRKDADKYGRVLAMEMGMMALVNYKGLINYPDRFPYWMPLPEPPKGE